MPFFIVPDDRIKTYIIFSAHPVAFGVFSLRMSFLQVKLKSTSQFFWKVNFYFHFCYVEHNKTNALKLLVMKRTAKRRGRKATLLTYPTISQFFATLS